MLLDLDVLAFSFGIPYGSPFGHRGFTHSFFFAAVLALFVVATSTLYGSTAGVRLWAYLFTATASHELIDACTNGGRGIGLLIPFTMRRYFFPWHPIQVCPIGVAWFFTHDAWCVLKNELLWVWLPAAAVFFLALAFRMAFHSGGVV